MAWATIDTKWLAFLVAAVGIQIVTLLSGGTVIMALASHFCACNLGVALKPKRAVTDPLMEFWLALSPASANDSVAGIRAFVVETLLIQGAVIIHLTLI